MPTKDQSAPEETFAEWPAIEKTLSFILCAVVISILFWALYLARYGIDFTDEGYYLKAISQPSFYAANVPPTMFGFVFNPIYELVGRDVVALRQFGIVSTFALACTLSFLALRSLWNTEGQGLLTVAAIASATACLALVYYSYLLMTPSYNLLAFQSLMIVSLGVLLMPRRSGLLGGVLIGIGGWLLFLAKPSSAAVIAFIVPLCLAVTGSFRLKPLICGALVALVLLLASSIMIDGSPIAFAMRISRSLALTQILGAGHGIATAFRIDNLNLTKSDVIPLASWAAAIALFLLAGLVTSRIIKALLFAGCLALAIAIGLYFLLGRPIYDAGQNRYLFLLALTLGTAAFATAIRSRTMRWKDVRTQMIIGGFFMILPHIFIFGSNNNYWESGASVGFFWILSALCFSGVLFAGPSRQRVASLLPVAFLFPFLTIVLLDRGVELPYRQPPDVRSFSTPYTLAEGGTLILADGFAQYLSTTALEADKAGLSTGANVIDMTGQSGGLLFALGLNSVGLPWLAGGYPGSDELATAVFATQSCSMLAGAWLLDEPEGRRRISPSTLLRFGADFRSDYELAGFFKVADYAGGRGQGVSIMQDLYKPIRSPAAARQACELALADRS